jgi:NADH-quinone oxidoreductase subunit G
MEAMVRTAAHFKGLEDDLPLEWESLRGVHEGVKTATIPGVGNVAVCNGIAAAQRLLEGEAWREDFVAIEVMACVGGCLGGGGEPKSLDPDILQKRAEGIYGLDAKAKRRRSYENDDVQALYASELGKPNSHAAHRLLHTHHAARRSKRSLIVRFLDAVDRRDGAQAASLFDPDGIWSTHSEFGDIKGAKEIELFINQKLPPRLYGPRFARHQIEYSADADDLVVLAPDGHRCRFQVEVTTVDEGENSKMVIGRITRTFC